MKLFSCHACGQIVHFENTVCERCGHALGYLPGPGIVSALEWDGTQGAWQALAPPGGLWLYCANYELGACNWMVPASGTGAANGGQATGGGGGSAGQALCPACALNRTIPDLTVSENLQAWQRLEGAKHRLVYALNRFGLPVFSKADDAHQGLAFDFMSDWDSPFGEQNRVLTGHAQGVITVNIAEADPARREEVRMAMGEPYRTLLGHLRHESGHYWWERLVQGSPRQDDFRALFGDERQDYAEALSRHYAGGPPTSWPAHYVSAYAASHPWEDWAETWTHTLHVIDTLETAWAFGIDVQPRHGSDPALAGTADVDPYDVTDFDALMEDWLPLAIAVNSLNRSMGQPDMYPFVLTPAVIEKMAFVHQVIRRGALLPV